MATEHIPCWHIHFDKKPTGKLFRRCCDCGRVQQLYKAYTADFHGADNAIGGGFYEVDEWLEAPELADQDSKFFCEG